MSRAAVLPKHLKERIRTMAQRPDIAIAIQNLYRDVLRFQRAASPRPARDPRKA